MSRRSRFEKRLAAIEASRPERRREAERRIRNYYRLHRSLPRGHERSATYIVPRQRLYTIICMGELEHLLGLASLILRLVTLRQRVVDILDRLMDGTHGS